MIPIPIACSYNNMNARPSSNLLNQSLLIKAAEAEAEDLRQDVLRRRNSGCRRRLLPYNLLTRDKASNPEEKEGRFRSRTPSLWT